MYDRIIEAMHATLEESWELAARRGAEDQRLFVSTIPVVNPEPHDYEIELHLVEPGTWRCIAVRRSWRHMAELVNGLTPLRLRKLSECARPCATHANWSQPQDAGG